MFLVSVFMLTGSESCRETSRVLVSISFSAQIPCSTRLLVDFEADHGSGPTNVCQGNSIPTKFRTKVKQYSMGGAGRNGFAPYSNDSSVNFNSYHTD